MATVSELSKRGLVRAWLLLLPMVMACGRSTEGGRRLTVSNCGVRDASRKSNKVMGRIVGGDIVEHGDFPWMVTIHENYYGFDHVCGGSIVNEHWILTAAHCIDYVDKPHKYEIYSGLHRLSKKSHKRATRHKISKILVHEDYDRNTLKNDIALLRTRKPIDIGGSSYVNGICLPETDKDPAGWATVTGWGHTLEKGDNSDILKSVNVPLVPRDLCKKAYEEVQDKDPNEEVADGMICAGTANRDSCQNDSGGPLVQKNRKGVYTQIGIVSFGNGCANRLYPGVYTKVAAYMDWMEKRMDT